jgi:hypothetical protein
MGSLQVPRPSPGQGWEPEPLYVPAGDVNEREPDRRKRETDSDDNFGSHVIVIDVS